jgi:hypothetical protein
MDDADESTKAKAPSSVIDLRAWKAKRELYLLAERHDWDKISRQLTSYAKKRIGKGTTGDQPEDLAHAAIVHFYAHMDTWDPEERPLLEHLRGVLDGIAVNKKRIGPNRGAHLEKREEGVQAFSSAEAPPEETAHETPHADAHARPAGGFQMPDTSRVDASGGEDEVAERELARRIIDATTQSLARDKIALEVVGAFAKGINDPKEQAVALGHPLQIILRARERVQWHAEKARAELEGSDER